MQQTDDEDWPDDDDDDGYIACPYCGETMLEAADFCPSCDRWITSEDQPVKRRSWWVLVVILVLVVTLIFSCF